MAAQQTSLSLSLQTSDDAQAISGIIICAQLHMWVAMAEESSDTLVHLLLWLSYWFWPLKGFRTE